MILFTDAYDVFFNKKPEIILTDFLGFENTKILFSGECGCWPHIVEDPLACFNKYPKSPTPYRYLNSGMWMGYAALASDMLGEIIRSYSYNLHLI